MPAMVIGVVAGVICLLAIGLKTKFGYDDSLDVVGVHLVGGLTGALLLGLFADTDASTRPVPTGCSSVAASSCSASRRGIVAVAGVLVRGDGS